MYISCGAFAVKHEIHPSIFPPVGQYRVTGTGLERIPLSTEHKAGDTLHWIPLQGIMWWLCALQMEYIVQCAGGNAWTHAWKNVQTPHTHIEWVGHDIFCKTFHTALWWKSRSLQLCRLTALPVFHSRVLRHKPHFCSHPAPSQGPLNTYYRYVGCWKGEKMLTTWGLPKRRALGGVPFRPDVNPL